MTLVRERSLIPRRLPEPDDLCDCNSGLETM